MSLTSTTDRLKEATRLSIEARKANDAKRAAGELPPRVTVVDLRRAIKAKCCECLGGGLPIEEIRSCSAGPQSRAPCPLWSVRPFR